MGGVWRSARGVFTGLVLTGAAASVLYSLWQEAPRWDELPSVAPLPERPGAPLEGHETLRGRVALPAGPLVTEVVVEARTAARLHWTRTDAGGRFELAGLPAGPLELVLLADGHAPGKVALELPHPGELALELPPVLPPLETLPAMERSDHSGELVLSVGTSPAGCEVLYRPAPRAHPLGGAVLRRVEVAPDGSFRAEGLVHGPYVLEVLPIWAAGGSWPVLTRGELVHAEGSPPMRLALRAGRVFGALRDAAGSPVEGALVVVSDADDPTRVWPAASSNDRGGFSVGDLPEGRFRVRVRAGDRASEHEVELAPAESLELQVDPLDL